jgi:hypothetical protein
LLQEQGSAGAIVFAIWQPMLATDWMAPSTHVLARMPDPRVRQYWDPAHLVAKKLAADARPPQPVQDCCVRNGILWDLAAVYPPGGRWDDRLPPAAVFNGAVVDVIDSIRPSLASTHSQSPQPGR